MHICKCFVAVLVICSLAFVTGAALGLPSVYVSVCVCVCITYLCKQKLFNLNITFHIVAEAEARLGLAFVGQR